MQTIDSQHVKLPNQNTFKDDLFMYLSNTESGKVICFTMH